MARDFRANQLRTFQIIGSGSTAAAGTQQENIRIQIYPSGKASDYAGNHSLDLSKVGKDVWMYIDGTPSPNNMGTQGPDGGDPEATDNMGANRPAGGSVLFAGDVVVSGTLYAQRSIIQVDEAVAGDLLVPNNLFVTGAAEFNVGASDDDFIVNGSSGQAKSFWVDSTPDAGEVVINDSGHANMDFRVESYGEDQAIFLDSSSNHLSINTGETAFTTTIHNVDGEAVSVTATEVVINDDGVETIDFRVESDDEDKAIFLDSSENHLAINVGKTAFTTTIHNTNGEAISVHAGEVIVNNDHNAGIDFRVEGDTETHLLFVDAGNERVSIGDSVDAPAATLEVTNHASAGAFNVPLVQLNSNDVDQVTLDINANTTTAQVIDIDATSTTSGILLDLYSNSLTSGRMIHSNDNSADTTARNVVFLKQNHASAIAATALKVQSDGGITGIVLDKNFSDTTAATVTGLMIDLDKTGASSSNNTIYGIDLDLDNTTATNGVTTMVGIRNTPTLTHNADAGTPSVIGYQSIITGGSNGTSTATGLDVTVTGADTNSGINLNVTDGGIDFKTVSSADTGDYFSIATTAHGATTITTVDDDATAAHLTMVIDGDITLKPAGGNVTLHDGSNDVFDFDVANTTLTIHDDQDTGDKVVMTMAQHGAFSIVTTDDDAAAANIQITADGTSVLAGTTVTLDSSGDIVLSADGDNIYMDNGSDTVFDFAVDTTPTLKIMDGAQVANYFSIGVGVNGETTLTTFDTDAAIAHLNIVVDGRLYMDSVGGAEINDSTGAISIGNDDIDQAVNIGTDGVRAIKVGTASGSGGVPSTSVDIDAVAVTIDATTGGVSIDAAGASNFTTTGGALTLKGATGETVGTAGQDCALQGSLTVAQNATITGNLTVNGTTTTLSTTTMTVEDRLIVLGVGNSGTTADLGIIFQRGDGSANKGIVWDESDDYFKVADVGSEAGASTNANFAISSVTPDNLMVGRLAIDSTADYIDVDTNLKIVSAADINLVPGGGDVNLAANIGLSFDGGTNDEKIESDGTDLTVNSGRNINLTCASGDVVIPVNIGLILGDGGEKIESDNTNLTIASGGKVTLDATTAVELNSGAGDIVLRDGATDQLKFDLDSTAGEVIISPQVASDDLMFANEAGNECMRISNTRGKVFFFDEDGEYIQSDGSTMTVAGGGGINLTAAAGDVIIPVNIGLVLGNSGEKIEGNGTGLTINGGFITLVSEAGISIDAGNGEITCYDAGSSFLKLDNATAGPTFMPQQNDEDIVFKGYTSSAFAEVCRIDSSASSLLMAGTKKIEFYDAGVFVHASADGKLALSADVNSADAIVLNASDSSGGIDLNVAGATVLSLDANSIDIAQQVNVDATTESSSVSTGALVVDGGVGIAKDLYVGDDLRLRSNSSVFAMGLDGDHFSITHDGTTGVTLAATTQININVAATSAWTASDGDLAIVADGADNKVTIKGDHTSGVAVHIDADQAAGSIVLLEAGVLDIDASGNITIDASGGSINVGTNSSERAVNIGHTTSEVTVKDNLTVDGDMSIGGTFAPSNLTLAANGYVYFGGNSHYVLRDGADLKFLDATVGSVKTLSDLAEKNVSTTAWTIIDGPGARMRTTASLSIDYDGKYVADVGSDIFLWVSGAIGGQGVTGSAAFGGDMVVSGNMHIGHFAITGSPGLGSIGTVLRTDVVAKKIFLSGTTVWGETLTTAPDGALKLVIGEGANVHNATFTNNVADKDIIFAINDSDGGGANTEVMRLKGSTTSIRIPPASKMEFGGASRYIKSDNTSLIELINSNNSGGVTITAGTTGNPGNITLLGHVIPSSNNLFDMGSSGSRWRNVYTSDLNLKNDRGDWTIIEESDYLCVINNATGKKFKMVLEPIEENE